MSDPQQALDWYLNVVNKVITDKPGPGGIEQHCDFPLLCELVKNEPTSAQIIIQNFENDVRGKTDAALQQEKKGNASLHGTWIMLAYLFEFGHDPDQEKFMRKTAGDLFARAEQAAKDGGFSWK